MGLVLVGGVGVVGGVGKFGSRSRESGNGGDFTGLGLGYRSGRLVKFLVKEKAYCY